MKPRMPGAALADTAPHQSGENMSPPQMIQDGLVRPEPVAKDAGKGSRGFSRRIQTLKDVVDWGLCTGCGACLSVCPVDAISGEKKMPHQLDQDKCVKCRACYEACKFEAVSVG